MSNGWTTAMAVKKKQTPKGTVLIPTPNIHVFALQQCFRLWHVKVHLAVLFHICWPAHVWTAIVRPNDCEGLWGFGWPDYKTANENQQRKTSRIVAQYISMHCRWHTSTNTSTFIQTIMSCSFAKFEAATSSTLISIELYTLRQPDSYQRANEMLRSCGVFSEHE